jgi:hypothetical protein
LLIYPRGRQGAYYLHGPKLYWREDPSAGHFANTSDSLPTGDAVSHVVGSGILYQREGDQYWPSWAAFARDVGLPAE